MHARHFRGMAQLMGYMRASMYARGGFFSECFCEHHSCGMSQMMGSMHMHKQRNACSVASSAREHHLSGFAQMVGVLSVCRVWTDRASALSSEINVHSTQEHHLLKGLVCTTQGQDRWMMSSCDAPLSSSVTVPLISQTGTSEFPPLERGVHMRWDELGFLKSVHKH